MSKINITADDGRINIQITPLQFSSVSDIPEGSYVKTSSDSFSRMVDGSLVDIPNIEEENSWIPKWAEELEAYSTNLKYPYALVMEEIHE